MLRESSKNQLGRPKKKVDKIFQKCFEKPPPLEKILDPHLVLSVCILTAKPDYKLLKTYSVRFSKLKNLNKNETINFEAQFMFFFQVWGKAINLKNMGL